MEEKIRITGAREHNLKNVSLIIPKNQLVVFTGLSGSGKSSLAFDTIYAEGQRRYVESLSSYARQFLGIMDKPNVDSIEGLSPAISIDQKSTSHNPRSTVGTITEIYDYLRLLFARVGHPHCPNCGREIERQSVDQITDKTLEFIRTQVKSLGRKPVRILVLSPVVRDRKGEFTQMFDSLRTKGYERVRLDGTFWSLNEDITLLKNNKHNIDVITDRLSIDKQTLNTQDQQNALRTRLFDAVEQAVAMSDGLAIIATIEDAAFDMPDKPKKTSDHMYSQKFSCPVCNISMPEIEPRLFSFNSPHGACVTCSGIGTLLCIDRNLILNPRLSISEGAILPFARMILSDSWYGRILLGVSDKIGLDTHHPLKDQQEEKIHKLLYGTGDEVHEIEGTNRFGRTVTIYETFNGVIPELERRFSQTESDYVRNEIRKYMREEICPQCHGARLKKEALSVTISSKSIVEITVLSIDKAKIWMNSLYGILSEREKVIGMMIIKEIDNRLNFLYSVGLDYLTLDRNAASLSGGELQRIRLASQIGSGLSGVLYVLDEPSIGLHQRDNRKLIDTLVTLKNLGNSVIVVEHDREMMENAQMIVDFGPGAGNNGGKVVAQGTYEEIIKNSQSVTGKYLSNKKIISVRTENHGMLVKDGSPELKITGCTSHNLKNLTVRFPLKSLICVTGVSGSGKSTLIVDTLYHALANKLNPFHKERGGKFSSLEGLDYINRVVLIDQSPIGRTPRSNPATYTGAFSFIRELYARMPDAKMRGYTPGRFSFNVKGGRCEACEGDGQTKIEMQFLPDVYVKCEVCGGSRFNSETLEVKYRDKSIADVLDLTVDHGMNFFENIPGLSLKLQTLHDVGLGYVHLGQPATTLSGGEAQRIKLATELSKRSTKDTVFILDEPTTGLHFADLEKLLYVLKELIRMGNTVIVIEHNLDVVKNADYVIDLGPEGGEKGGKIIAECSPSDLMKNPHSYTGKYLKEYTEKLKQR